MGAMAHMRDIAARTDTSSGQARFTLKDIPGIAGGGYELNIEGRMPVRWASHLTHGLSTKGISIVSGYARKSMDQEAMCQVWRGRFTIEGAAMGSTLRAMDFAGMIDTADGPLSSTAPAPELGRFSISECVKGTGALYVKIEGKDRLGFLDGILRTFAFCALYPQEMVVDTIGGRVMDRFHLMGFGGGRPIKSSRLLLQSALNNLMS